MQRCMVGAMKLAPFQVFVPCFILLCLWMLAIFLGNTLHFLMKSTIIPERLEDRYIKKKTVA